MRTELLTRQVRRGHVYRKRQWVGSKPWTLVFYCNGKLFRLTSEKESGTALLACRRPNGEWLTFDDMRKDRVKAMKRRGSATTPADGASHLAPLESQVFGKLHPLVAHCAVVKYDDGEPRKPGWFTVKAMGAAWVVEVKDPDSCSRLVCVGNTLDDALALASVLLESAEAPWEPDTWLAQQAAKQKTKK